MCGEEEGNAKEWNRIGLADDVKLDMFQWFGCVDSIKALAVLKIIIQY